MGILKEKYSNIIVFREWGTKMEKVRRGIREIFLMTDYTATIIGV